MKNLEPFNYNLCLERGGYAITRDGERMRLLCNDAPGPLPILAVGEEAPFLLTQCQADGTSLAGGSMLFTPPPEPKRIRGYIAIAQDGQLGTGVWPSRYEAKVNGQAKFGHDPFSVTPIDVAEGEGLEITDADYPEPEDLMVEDDGKVDSFTKGKTAGDDGKLHINGKPVPEDEGRIVAVVPLQPVNHCEAGKPYKVICGLDKLQRYCVLNRWDEYVHIDSEIAQPIYSNRVYAVTDYDGCPYITAGKVYEVTPQSETAFECTDDNGETVFSGWHRAEHLDNRSWVRINGADYK